ncbi:DUF3263 domain-containing protein [Arthrobacter sp. CP30]
MLTERDRLILDFEGKHLKHQGSKEGAIRDLFGSVTLYCQQLAHLLTTEQAPAYSPMTVRRMQRRLRPVHNVNTIGRYGTV